MINYNFFLIFLIITLFVSCSEEYPNTTIVKEVRIRNLRKAILDKGMYTPVELIATYANENVCQNGLYNADLYVCRNVENNDTIYVFDVCEKIASFSMVGTEEVFVIEHDDIKNITLESVIVKVPKRFVIPDKSLYLVANLTRHLD